MLVAQSCPTLWDPMDCSPLGFCVHELFQARILEWVAISFSRGSSQPRDWTRVSCTAGRFCTDWATRKALPLWLLEILKCYLWLECISTGRCWAREPLQGNRKGISQSFTPWSTKTLRVKFKAFEIWCLLCDRGFLVQTLWIYSISFCSLPTDIFQADSKKDKSKFLSGLSEEDRKSCKWWLLLPFGESEKSKGEEFCLSAYTEAKYRWIPIPHQGRSTGIWICFIILNSGNSQNRD